jgi:hypothetical protein
VWRYVDSLGSWSGNERGKNLLRRHISTAFREQLPVRMVVATTGNPDEVDQSHDASKVKESLIK